MCCERVQHVRVGWEVEDELVVRQAHALPHDQQTELLTVGVDVVAPREPVFRDIQMLHYRHQQHGISLEQIGPIHRVTDIVPPYSASRLPSIGFICLVVTVTYRHPTTSGWPPPLDSYSFGGSTYILALGHRWIRTVLSIYSQRCFLDLDYNQLIDIYPNPPAQN